MTAGQTELVEALEERMLRERDRVVFAPLRIREVEAPQGQVPERGDELRPPGPSAVRAGDGEVFEARGTTEVLERARVSGLPRAR
ncbi:MAG: hypothetical protein H6723_15915 [Sandaracinus sp.]|nr:hypothetical protein [Sandaracinus sp.]